MNVVQLSVRSPFGRLWFETPTDLPQSSPVEVSDLPSGDCGLKLKKKNGRNGERKCQISLRETVV